MIKYSPTISGYYALISTNPLGLQGNYTIAVNYQTDVHSSLKIDSVSSMKLNGSLLIPTTTFSGNDTIFVQIAIKNNGTT